MDSKVLKSILRRLNKLENRSVRLRYGVVTATSPLTVKLGNADVDYANVRQLNTGALAVNDHVAILIRSNDLLVLGKVI